MLRLDPGGVLRRDLPLQRGGDQDVAVELERVLPPREVGGAGEAEQAPPLPPVRHHLLQVEPVRVGDRALGLGQPDQDRAGLPGRTWRRSSPRCPAPGPPPACPRCPGRGPSAFMSSATPADLAGAEEDAPPRGLGPAADPAGAHRLGGDAAERVELARAELGVGVGDPGHLPRAGAHVGRGDVESRADEVLAHQLEHVAPGDPLQLADRVAAGDRSGCRPWPRRRGRPPARTCRSSGRPAPAPPRRPPSRRSGCRPCRGACGGCAPPATRASPRSGRRRA